MSNGIKCCFIVCWIGKLPEYYELWARSCSYNKNYDFYIITDQKIDNKYHNIHIINKTLCELNDLFSRKLNLKINIKKPYKFCDFRPAYGIIFEDFIKKYDFWGHCDIDQIFGNIDSFVTKRILKDNEVINRLGHFKLYVNDDKINNLYKQKGSKFNYKEVFLSDYNYAFDEVTGIGKIIEYNNIKNYIINDFCDISVRHSRFIDNNSLNFKFQLYTYEEGRLFKVFLDNGNIIRTEKMYLHFQKKYPNVYINDNNYKFILIGSKGIITSKDKKITKELMNEINHYNGLVYEMLENISYNLKKMKKFLFCNFEEKKIWMKQKISNLKRKSKI